MGEHRAVAQDLRVCARQGTSDYQFTLWSQDLDELYEISDRLVVICAGRLSAPRQTRRADRGEIGMLMAGVGMKGAANAARP